MEYEHNAKAHFAPYRVYQELITGEDLTKLNIVNVRIKKYFFEQLPWKKSVWKKWKKVEELLGEELTGESLSSGEYVNPKLIGSC